MDSNRIREFALNPVFSANTALGKKTMFLAYCHLVVIRFDYVFVTATYYRPYSSILFPWSSAHMPNAVLNSSP